MIRSHTALCTLFLLAVLLPTPGNSQEAPLGYTDTPELPGQPFKVHDPTRPQPPVVVPGAAFSHAAPAPSDATVLFGGSNLSAWVNSKGEPAEWRAGKGFFEVVGGKGSIRTKEQFGDFQLHLEFATPEVVEGSSQGRGNSGVMIYGKYEVQVLDSYRNPTYPDGQAASIYGQFPPQVNASRPPGEWQTYDIVFEGPRWEGADLVKKAAVTVLHNGVLVHHRKEYIGITSHRQVGTYSRMHPPEGYIELQDHGNPVRYRNIWIRELVPYDSGEALSQ